MRGGALKYGIDRDRSTKLQIEEELLQERNIENHLDGAAHGQYEYFWILRDDV